MYNSHVIIEQVYRNLFNNTFKKQRYIGIHTHMYLIIPFSKENIGLFWP